MHQQRLQGLLYIHNPGCAHQNTIIKTHAFWSMQQKKYWDPYESRLRALRRSESASGLKSVGSSCMWCPPKPAFAQLNMDLCSLAQAIVTTNFMFVEYHAKLRVTRAVAVLAKSRSIISLCNFGHGQASKMPAFRKIMRMMRVLFQIGLAPKEHVWL